MFYIILVIGLELLAQSDDAYVLVIIQVIREISELYMNNYDEFLVEQTTVLRVIYVCNLQPIALPIYYMKVTA